MFFCSSEILKEKGRSQRPATAFFCAFSMAARAASAALASRIGSAPEVRNQVWAIRSSN